MKKEIIKSVRFSLDEYLLINRKSTDLGISSGTFIREKCLESIYSQKYGAQQEFNRNYYELAKNINKIGNNINQIAIVANSTKYVVQMKELRESFIELTQQIRSVLEKIR